MRIDALCECCLSAALHMKRAISLPLPDLGPPTTHRQQCPLPCLLDPEGHRTTKWVAGMTCSSIYRGGVGSGDVSLQAYHLIHNLHVKLAKIPIDACGGWDRLASDLTVAGLSLLEWGLVGLTSSLLGLPVKTTRRVIQTTSEQEFLQSRSARADLQPQALTASARKHVQLAPVPRPPIPDTSVRLQVLDCVSRGAIQARLARGAAAFGEDVGGNVHLGVAMRVGSVCTLTVCNGLPSATFSSMVDVLDAHWPESVGHVNLSEHFVAKFKVSLLQAVNVAQTSAMHALLLRCVCRAITFGPLTPSLQNMVTRCWCI